MPEELIPSTPPGNPERERFPNKVTCEFCECELGRSGEYKQLSDTAKRYRKLKDENEKLEQDLTKVRQECEELKRKLEALAPKDRVRKEMAFGQF
jgi:predicted RNase H-like nuclease (RuvC/YqgF family)